MTRALYAACFEAAMLLAAQRIDVPVEQVGDVAIESKVMLIPAGARALKLGVELAVELPSLHDPERAAELVRVTHGICPYSNATRGNVDVALSVNGVAVETEAAAGVGADSLRGLRSAHAATVTAGATSRGGEPHRGIPAATRADTRDPY